MKIKSVSGVVKYNPHKREGTLIIPVLLEDLELETKQDDTKEVKTKKDELVKKLGGLCDVYFVVSNRNPDICLDDRITVHPSFNLGDKYLKGSGDIGASQIDILNHGKNVIASYYAH